MAEFLAQLTINSIMAGSLYLILGLSFSVIYHMTGTFHFAHAFVIVVAAYTAVVVTTFAGLPLILGFVAAIVVAIIVGCAIELWIYRPITRAGGTRFGVFIGSLGVLIVGQNLFLIIFTANVRIVEGWELVKYAVGPVCFTNLHILYLVLAISVFFGFWWFLNNTRVGKAMRAVASNPEMSQIVGIDKNWIDLLAYIIGSGIAGLAAVLYTLDFAARPHMGIAPVFSALIVTFMAGVGSLPGIVIAAYVLALAENMSLIFIPAEWKIIVSFIILLAVIILRPQGLIPLGYQWRMPKFGIQKSGGQ